MLAQRRIGPANRHFRLLTASRISSPRVRVRCTTFAQPDLKEETRRVAKCASRCELIDEEFDEFDCEVGLLLRLANQP